MTVQQQTDEQPAQPTPPAPTEIKPKVDLASPIGDLDVAWRLANSLAQSSLMPDALKNKASDVLVTLMYGRELGLAPMQAIQTIYVVKGRPTLSYQGWLALTRQAGHQVRFVEHTEEVCTVEIIRRDDPEQPVRATFTMEDAKRAKLADKDVWKQHPRNMLLARAVANACRAACPEVALGFGTEDEVDKPAARAATLAEAAAEREAAKEDAASRQPATDPDADVQDAELVDDDADAKDVQNAAAIAALAAEHSTTGTAQPAAPPAAEVPAEQADTSEVADGELVDPPAQQPASPVSELPADLFGDDVPPPPDPYER